MLPTAPPLTLPVRLVISASIPVGDCTPAAITVTLDPPNDRYEVVWYQDTITDVFTPEEALDAIHTMVLHALRVMETGRIQKDHLPPMPGQETLFG